MQYDIDSDDDPYDLDIKNGDKFDYKCDIVVQGQNSIYQTVVVEKTLEDAFKIKFEENPSTSKWITNEDDSIYPYRFYLNYRFNFVDYLK